MKTAAEKRERAQNSRLMMFFRITLEEHCRIREYQASQNDLKLLLAEPGKREATEHRHSDGLVRGVMEWRLNKGYGLIEQVAGENTAAVLRALAEFHENPPATIVLGGPRYGILNKAKKKKKMVYGSINGPLPTKKGK